MKKGAHLDEFFFRETPKVTDELVEYYRDNPEELDLIVDKELFHSRFLTFFFILGIGLTFGSRLFMFLLDDTQGAFVRDVLFDVSSELGIAVFGGAVTAYYLEFLRKKQYEQNIQFRNEIMSRL